jgi:hypothetical protein
LRGRASITDLVIGSVVDSWVIVVVYVLVFLVKTPDKKRDQNEFDRDNAQIC